MGREVSSGVVVYLRSEQGPKFLLLYHGSGYWNFPKGKLEDGERSFRAALREVREETGIGASSLRFRDFFRVRDTYVFMRHGDRILKLVTFYLAESASNRVHVSDEHEGYGWFLYRDAVRMLRHKNLRSIIRRAYETIVRPAKIVSPQAIHAGKHDRVSEKGMAGGYPDSSRPGRDIRRGRTGARLSEA